MGVPAFYRWLITKYPKIGVNAKEEKKTITDDDDDGVVSFVDATAPNPNGFEFDNLYLDMNGVIHPCFHPDHDDNPPTTFEEVFERVFSYIDRLFAIVRPRKLLFLSIDGVAPRAKMNQQRTRRFQTAKNTQLAEEEEQRLREQYEKQGKKLPPKVESQLSDSNVITPGTQFMWDLSGALQLYIRDRISNQPAWRDIKVILSDANVPGEGEHKIMSFIRSQRTLPGYNPNTRHCLYGLDADLIMLALASHEFHFSILREDVLEVKEELPATVPTTLSMLQNARLDTMPKCRGWFPQLNLDKQKPAGNENRPYPVKWTNGPALYQFVHVWILREYLELDLQLLDVQEGFKYDFERVIDDFIFMCFFVGNDFLPHMPTLEIREGAIDLLMEVYKKEFKSLGGYLLDTQRINERHCAYIKLKRVEKFILSVGRFEDKIFEKRRSLKERQMRRLISELSLSKNDDNNDGVDEVFLTTSAEEDLCSEVDDMLQNTIQMKADLGKMLKEKSDLLKSGKLCNDKVKFGEFGWKERYYKEKFSAADDQQVESIRKALVTEYTVGLCWVIQYYFSGVPSWTWFYPYHYGPCASDLKGLSQVKVKFQVGSPFAPFDQLMGVLPPKSCLALPKAYRTLMTDPESEIIDFYPDEYDIDLSGKRFLWQGICKLPFINEKRLLSATIKMSDKIESYDAQRNAVKLNKLFLRLGSEFGCELKSLLSETASTRESSLAIPTSSVTIEMKLSDSGSIAGLVHICLEALLNKHPDEILCANIEFPDQKAAIPRLLEGLEYPEKVVFESDIVEILLWHEHHKGYHPILREVPMQRNLQRLENEGVKPYTGGFDRRGAGRGRGRGHVGPGDKDEGSWSSSSSSSGFVPRHFHSSPRPINNTSFRPPTNSYVAPHLYGASGYNSTSAGRYPFSRPSTSAFVPQHLLQGAGPGFVPQQFRGRGQPQHLHGAAFVPQQFRGRGQPQHLHGAAFVPQPFRGRGQAQHVQGEAGGGFINSPRPPHAVAGNSAWPRPRLGSSYVPPHLRSGMEEGSGRGQ